MGLRHDGARLRAIVQGLVRMLEALRACRPVELVEAELEIPFAGILPRGAASVGLEHFRSVSLVAEDIGSSSASDLWKIRISIGRNRASTVTVERYDSPAAS